MSDSEIRRERIVEREVPVEGRRTIVERRGGYGGGFGMNPFAGILMAVVVILLVLLILGVLV